MDKQNSFVQTSIPQFRTIHIQHPLSAVPNTHIAILAGESTQAPSFCDFPACTTRYIVIDKKDNFYPAKVEWFGSVDFNKYSLMKTDQ
ncbi:MAG TPA: hypothetical protein PKK99_12950, partial [Bacteroidia bacterium]|nr:hypothetical protein [Bacteroidia bacterium]